MTAAPTQLSPWDRVQLARHPHRPHTRDYVRGLCQNFVELHGDRCFGDDAAIVAGLAHFMGRTVAILGHQKGNSTRENLRCNFGSAHPEGYRKAARLMRQAEKFAFPLLCFIDTPGASPNMAAEERGQAQAIAESLLIMAGLATPIVAVVIGEGGSGGALAIGVADRLIMLENAVYSVASPEPSAAILWHDAAQAPDAAEAMRITAADVHAMGIADEVVPEAPGGAQLNPQQAIRDVGEVLRRHLHEVTQIPFPDLLRRRYDKFRHIGIVVPERRDDIYNVSTTGDASTHPEFLEVWHGKDLSHNQTVHCDLDHLTSMSS